VLMLLWIIAACCTWTSTAFLMRSQVQLFPLQKTFSAEQHVSQILLKYKTSVYEDVNIKTENSTTFIPAPNVPVASTPKENQPTLATMKDTPPTLDDSFESSSSFATTYSPQDVWETHVPTSIQGGSIRTWTFDTPKISTVQVHLKTDGRPMNANGTYVFFE
jgi:hypothetical protein